MRERIVAEIKRIYEATGIVPGMRTFQQQSGIAEKEWKGKIWARWGDALIEAGFSPNTLTPRISDEEILQAFADVCIEFGKLPTGHDWRIIARQNPELPSNTTITAHFPSRTMLVDALRHWLSCKPEYGAVLGMLPRQETVAMQPVSRQEAGYVYLIKSGEYYKIGRSSELERRVKEIRVALPQAAVLEHTILTDDPAGIETYWHRRFADRRANGEWFKLKKADVLAFKKRKFQ